MSHPTGTCWDGATFPGRWGLAAMELEGRAWDGSANFVCCHVLWALAPSCGCCVACPVSRGPLGCCCCLGLVFVLAGLSRFGDTVHLQDLALYHTAHGT